MVRAEPPEAGKTLRGMLDMTGRAYEKALDRDLDCLFTCMRKSVDF